MFERSVAEACASYACIGFVPAFLVRSWPIRRLVVPRSCCPDAHEPHDWGRQSPRLTLIICRASCLCVAPRNGRPSGRGLLASLDETTTPAIDRPLGLGSPPVRLFRECHQSAPKVRASVARSVYWYPVEIDRNLGTGKVHRGHLLERARSPWFRARDGLRTRHPKSLRHRHSTVTKGEVMCCTLFMPLSRLDYYGSGKVVAIPHDLFGREMPTSACPSITFSILYTAIWIFPGVILPWPITTSSRNS